ncbi:hypothetical protein ACFL1E_03075 [Candidatus Omnitrophota bacterium]
MELGQGMKGPIGKKVKVKYFSMLMHLRLSIKISIVVALFLIISLSVFFAKVYPNLVEAGEKNKSFRKCADEAFISYKEQWAQECAKLKMGSSCGLPDEIAKSLDDALNNVKRDCRRRQP